MADDKDIADEQPAGGKKKLIIIIAVAVALLLGAAAAAFFLMGGEEEAAEDGEANVGPAAVEEVDPVYHTLAPTFVVSLPEGGSAGMLQIAIDVMTQHPTVVETLTANDPMIRHHLINLLESQRADELLTIEGKQALQTAIHELLAEKLTELKEPGEIKGIFFTQLVLQ